MRISKPLKIMRSLLVLFVGVGLLSMSLQMIVMERLHNESLGYYQNALIDSRFYETTSFAKLVRNDMDTFGTQIYMLYSGTEFKRLKTSLNEGAITGHYLQDCQYIWSELKMRMLDNSLLSDVSLYMMDSRRKVTTGSVVRFSDDESKWLEELTRAESGVALFDQTLYLWIPRFYGKYRRAEDMDCIAVGSITESNARKYLNQFSADISEANLMLIYMDDRDARLLAQLDHDPASLGWIAEAGISREKPSGYAVLTDTDRPQLVTWAQIGNLPIVFCEMMPVETLNGEMSQYEAHLILYRILVLLFTLLLMVMLYTIVRHPLRRIRMALQAIEKGDLSKRLPKTAISDFDYVNEQFNAMSTRIQSLVEKEYMLRLLHVKAELRQLQYQINPHFLYNTYFTLRSLLEDEENEKAAAFADVLGRYMKYSVSAKEEYATLAEEIGHAKNYAEIQQTRFGKRIDLQWDIDMGCLPELKVPKLILQPLIENAFEHGVRRMLEGGIIRVTFREDGAVMIAVEDNGQSLTDERLEKLAEQLRQNQTQPEDDSVALLNIHRRLQILFGERSGLNVSRSELGGLKVTVVIDGEMIDV